MDLESIQPMVKTVRIVGRNSNIVLGKTTFNHADFMLYDIPINLKVAFTTFSLFIYLGQFEAHGILVPRPGTKPVPPQQSTVAYLLDSWKSLTFKSQLKIFLKYVYFNLFGTIVLCLVTQMCLTLRNPVDYSSPGSSVHGNSPGKNSGVGCHALFQAQEGYYQDRTLFWLLCCFFKFHYLF